MAAPTVEKDVAFVCTTIILYRIGLTGTH